MIEEFLRNTSDHEFDQLEVNWVQKFLIRHQDLRSAWAQALNKERAARHDDATINN